MAGQIGKASIEIVADLSKFPPELKAKLKAAFAEGVKGVDIETPLGDKAEKAGNKAATRAGKGFLSKARGEFKKAGESLGKDLFGAIGNIFSRDSVSRRGGGFSGLIKNLFSEGQEAIKSGIAGLQAAGAGIGQVFSSISGTGGDIASLVKGTAIIAAIPAVFALAGALVHLTGILLALPAVIGVAAAALAPLVIGFQGFGEAIGAGLSGDVDKFNASLKNLPLGMRAVIKEVVGFRKPLQQLKKDVQQGLFSELVGQVKPTLAALLPVLSRGLVQVAGSFSVVFAKVAQTLRDPAVLGVLQQLFVVTSNIVEDVGVPLVHLFRSFFLLMGAGLPTVQRGFKGLGEGIERFATFLEGITKDGRFNTFLTNAVNIVKDLGALLKSTGKLVGAIFGGQDVEQSSEGFIKNVTKAIDKLTEFFKSADGKRTIDAMISTIKGLGIVIIALAIAFGTIAGWVFDFVDAIKAAASAVGSFLQAVGSGFVSAISAIGGFFADIGGAVADFFTKTIPDAFNAVVDFFTNLPTTISNLLGDLVDAVTFKIGQILGTFLALPFLIWNAMQTLPGLVFGVLETVVNFLQQLPGKALNALLSFASVVGGAIKSGIDAAYNFVVNGVESIARLIGSLPGRVAALGPALLNAARSLGRKIGDGLSEIGNFASDIGHKIVSAVKGGINRIIDGINGGIADIDSKIPISLPRLPHFERGGIIDSPTVALVGEKGKKEVVLPLTDPQRTRELAQQSGLTKILGSGGAAPTVNLTAILDGMGLIKVIRMEIDSASSDQGSELAFGART
jgi:hypothetical protein